MHTTNCLCRLPPWRISSSKIQDPVFLFPSQHSRQIRHRTAQARQSAMQSRNLICEHPLHIPNHRLKATLFPVSEWQREAT